MEFPCLELDDDVAELLDVEEDQVDVEIVAPTSKCTCRPTNPKPEPSARLDWHSRAWENSPLHTMPDILVQLKTAIEALSGKSGTVDAIPVLEGIYRSVVGTIGASDFLWQESGPRFPRGYKKVIEYSSFGHWYWFLADTRNAIVHDTESPFMEHIAPGSPFQGNLFRVAERVTRELIKIRLAHLGHPEAALSPTSRGHLHIAGQLGQEIRTIAPLPI